MSLYICMAAFIACLIAGRRSLVTGLSLLLALGYAYGIVRANLPDTYSHFIFDAGVLGFYCGQLIRHLTPAESYRIQSLRPWLEPLITWPLIMCLIPNQDTLIRFVGLRGNIFLLPFMLVGACLSNKERYNLAIRLAILNIVAFIFASAEFFTSIESFFPYNEVTRLIYLSKDVAQSAYR